MAQKISHPEDHPYSIPDIMEYLENKMDEQRVAQFEKHLIECEICQNTAYELTRIDVFHEVIKGIGQWHLGLKEIKALLAEDLSLEEKRRFENHINACKNCKRAVEIYKANFEKINKKFIDKIFSTEKEQGVSITIAVAIVKKDGTILLVRRRQREGSLHWQFPSGSVKQKEEAGRTAERKVFDKTSVVCQVTKLIGKRIHPETEVQAMYFLSTYISGETFLKDTEDLDEVKWVSAQDALRMITSNVFPPVREYLAKFSDAA